MCRDEIMRHQGNIENSQNIKEIKHEFVELRGAVTPPWIRLCKYIISLKEC